MTRRTGQFKAERPPIRLNKLSEAEAVSGDLGGEEGTMASDIKWIKITTDMFEDEKLDFISSLPEADAIIVIWIRLLTLAGKCNAGGFVFLTEKIPYTDEMLAHKFKKPLNVVKMALETFRRLDMIDMEGQVIYLPNWEKHQNIDGMEKIRLQNRERKRSERERKKLLLEPPTDKCHVTVTGQSQLIHATDIDKEKEIIYIPEIDDVKSIFEYWNVKGIVKHRELTQKMRSSINARLETYTVDELKEAIDNYDSILKSDKHFFSYKWALIDFFNPNNIVMFLTENDPFANYLSDKHKRKSERPGYQSPTVVVTNEERDRLAEITRRQRERNLGELAANH